MEQPKDIVITSPQDLRYWIRRIKEERAELKRMLANYNEMKEANKYDNRLAGYSYAINCQKGLIDDIQWVINNYNQTQAKGE